MSDTILLPQHRTLIDGSAIDPEVARERGYSSESTRAELQRRGFSERQCGVPALLIPIHNVDGEIATYQTRPDHPRVDDKGKVIKYETPRGSRMVLDVPPRCRTRRWIGDPHVPLFITEGARKADAGVSKGLCTLALLGVWNFKGTNEQGGSVELSDWDRVAIKGREAYIIFDSDVVSKSAVLHALVRLKGMLERRGANVRVVYLDPGVAGTKVGLDDYFHSGGDVSGLLLRATDTLRQLPGSGSRCRFATTDDGRTIFNRPIGEGETIEDTLAHFTAKITEEVIEDDGAECKRLYRIAARVRGRAYDINVPVERFSAMNWPSELLEAKAIVRAGMGCKDHLREAILVLSDDEIPCSRVYLHLGWVQIADGSWVYLHSQGAIGNGGPVKGVAVRIERPLHNYVLPPPPEGEELKHAVRQALSILDGLAPDHVVFPLFSIIWTALLDISRASLHLVGKTGVRKTELAALIQRFFGALMDAPNLPGNWSSTGNSLEMLAFLAKNAVLVVDDFNPTGSAGAVEKQNRDADRFMRAQANGSGRGRLRADGTPRPAKPPRGVVLSTGEDVPAGHSLRARMLVIEVGVGEVNLDKLTQCQKDAEAYSQVTSAFIAKLASSFGQLRALCKEKIEEHRTSLLEHSSHGRTATLGADLLVGLQVFLQFAESTDAIDSDEAEALYERGHQGILHAVARQGDHQAASDPAHLFVQLVAAALQAGDAHLVDRNSGGVPKREEIARAVGWRRPENTDSTSAASDWRPSGPEIGWIDDEDDSIYFNPTPAYRAVQRQGENSPTRIGIGERTLWKRLYEAGLLVSTDPERHTVKFRMGTRTPNGLHLRASLVLDETGTSGTGEETERRAPEQPIEHSRSVPDLAWTHFGPGTPNGNNPTSGGPKERPDEHVPDAPDLPRDGGELSDDLTGVRPVSDMGAEVSASCPRTSEHLFDTDELSEVHDA